MRKREPIAERRTYSPLDFFAAKSAPGLSLKKIQGASLQKETFFAQKN
jgi:hypothetical protein